MLSKERPIFFRNLKDRTLMDGLLNCILGPKHFGVEGSPPSPPQLGSANESSENEYSQALYLVLFLKLCK